MIDFSAKCQQCGSFEPEDSPGCEHCGAIICARCKPMHLPICRHNAGLKANGGGGTVLHAKETEDPIGAIMEAGKCDRHDATQIYRAHGCEHATPAQRRLSLQIICEGLRVGIIPPAGMLKT